MESAHVFGEFEQLVGVYRPGKNELTAQNDVAVIMLTAGMLHSTGPFRMYVNFSNQLAEQGFASFRFDLSGIGESLPVGSAGSSLQRAASEAGQAMDFLETEFGIKRFILMGLCSGADDAFHTANVDSRVDGVILLDGCGYPTGRFKLLRIWKHYLPRLLNPKFLLSKLGRLGKSNSTVSPASLAFEDDIREFPSRDVAAKQLQGLTDRGAKLNFVYTGGVNWYYNYEQQFEDMFADVDFKGNVSIEYYPHMDHVAFLVEDRKELVDALVAWTKKQFVSQEKPEDQSSQNTPIIPLIEMPTGIGATSTESI